MKVNESLKWRYALTKFDVPKEISEGTLHEILEAGNLSATSFGLQPFEFVVVKNQEIKEKLVPASFGQEHVAKNSALIVLAIRTDLDEKYVNEFVERTSKTRNIPLENLNEYKDMMVGFLNSKSQEEKNNWASKQAYIALGTLMVAASEAGIDNHALEGFDPNKYDKILGLKEKNLHSTVILALGYRQSEDASQNLPKVRKSYEEIVNTI